MEQVLEMYVKQMNYKLSEIRESIEPINFNDLKYNFKSPEIAPDVEKEQIKLKSDLSHIRQGSWKHKPPEQIQTIRNIENLYNSREKVVKMFNDYPKNISRNIYESKQGKGLKILTPKQMLQSLTIAYAKIKAVNNLESLLNEIRQIVYSLYQSKENTKKVYNNIIKSIKIYYKKF